MRTLLPLLNFNLEHRLLSISRLQLHLPLLQMVFKNELVKVGNLHVDQIRRT